MEGLVLKHVETHVAIQDMENFQDIEIILAIEAKYHTSLKVSGKSPLTRDLSTGRETLHLELKLRT